MHQINLHGPWNLSPLASGEASQDSVRLKYPCRPAETKIALTEGFWLCRNFHAPTGIAESDRIQLLFAFEIVPVEIKLNNDSVEFVAADEVQLDVTQKLNSFNQVCILINGLDSIELPEFVFRSAKMLIE